MNEKNDNKSAVEIKLLDFVSYDSKDYKLMHGVRKNVEGIVLGIIRGMNNPLSIHNNFLELQSEVDEEYYFDIIKIDKVKMIDTANFHELYPGANFLADWPANNIIMEVKDMNNTYNSYKGIIVSTQIELGLEKLIIKLYDMDNISSTIELLEHAASEKFLKQIKNKGFDSPSLIEDIKKEYVKGEILEFLNTEKYHNTIRSSKSNKVFFLEEYLDNLRRI